MEFARDYDHRPHPAQVVAYLKGQRLYLPDAIASDVIDAGAASEIEKPEDLRSNKDGSVSKVEPAPRALAKTEK
ncbi:MAG: hypothetical protein DI629_12120 [Mesorhizobium amorphae]|nr:MAG: hypothetical protein DI629_12120 [Mesorhizobium amorphae]